MRKFTEKVIMPATYKQYEESLKVELSKMGYDVLTNEAVSMKCLFINTLSNGGVRWYDESKYMFVGVFGVSTFNPGLFLALAASGEAGYWEGEWVVYRGQLYKIKELQDGPRGTLSIVIIENEKGNNVVGLESVHKATREEIIAHFSRKEDIKCAPRLPGALTEERSPRGVMPRWRWLELRAIDLQEAIYRYHDARQDPPKSYYSEWNIIIDELTKLGKVPTFTQIEAAKKLTELLQVPLIRITKD